MCFIASTYALAKLRPELFAFTDMSGAAILCAAMLFGTVVSAGAVILTVLLLAIAVVILAIVMLLVLILAAFVLLGLWGCLLWMWKRARAYTTKGPAQAAPTS